MPWFVGGSNRAAGTLDLAGSARGLHPTVGNEIGLVGKPLLISRKTSTKFGEHWLSIKPLRESPSLGYFLLGRAPPPGAAAADHPASSLSPRHPLVPFIEPESLCVDFHHCCPQSLAASLCPALHGHQPSTPELEAILPPSGTSPNCCLPLVEARTRVGASSANPSSC